MKLKCRSAHPVAAFDRSGLAVATRGEFTPKNSKKLVAHGRCFDTFSLRLPDGKPGQLESLRAHADNQPTGPQRPEQDQVQVQVARLGEFAVSSWGVHSGHDAHAQETEFSDAQSGQGALDQRV